MKIESAYFSRKGRKELNEDAVLPPILVRGLWWAAVADGMGGHVGGSVASSSVIEAIKSSIEGQVELDIARLFVEAQERLKAIEREKPDLAEMGTTLSLLSLSEKIANVGHVGDSRIYHLRSEGIVDRTVDQTEVEQLVQQRVLSKASARRYPRRHVLLSVLSASRSFELHREQFEIQAGDRLVLLTDGVSSKVLRQEIRDMSRRQPDPKSFCAALVDEIEKRLPQDDYSAICLDIKP